MRWAPAIVIVVGLVVMAVPVALVVPLPYPQVSPDGRIGGYPGPSGVPLVLVALFVAGLIVTLSGIAMAGRRRQ